MILKTSVGSSSAPSLSTLSNITPDQLCTCPLRPRPLWAFLELQLHLVFLLWWSVQRIVTYILFPVPFLMTSSTWTHQEIHQATVFQGWSQVKGLQAQFGQFASSVTLPELISLACLSFLICKLSIITLPL